MSDRKQQYAEAKERARTAANRMGGQYSLLVNAIRDMSHYTDDIKEMRELERFVYDLVDFARFWYLTDKVIGGLKSEK